MARGEADGIEPVTLNDLEDPIAELRDGTRALLAMNPHFAIGDAGVLWIASKMEESVELLHHRWRALVDAPTEEGDAAEDTDP